MYCMIYLDDNRRVKIYEEGGIQQEVYQYSGGTRIAYDWFLANDENWPELPRVLNTFMETIVRAKGNLAILSNETLNKYRESLENKYGKAVIDEAISMYETDFDKEFYRDLTREEQLDYISKAKYNLFGK